MYRKSLFPIPENSPGCAAVDKVWGRKVAEEIDTGATPSRSKVSKRPAVGVKLGG